MSLWTKLFRRKPDPSSPPVAPLLPLLPAGVIEVDPKREQLAQRIERMRVGIARQSTLPHGRKGCLRDLGEHLAKLESDLADLDRAHEDAILASLKEAVAILEARRAAAAK